MSREHTGKRQRAITRLRYVRSRFRKDRLINALLLSGAARLSRGRLRALRSHVQGTSRRKHGRTSLIPESSHNPTVPATIVPDKYGLHSGTSVNGHGTTAEGSQAIYKHDGLQLREDPRMDSNSNSIRPKVKQKRVFTDGNLPPESSPQMKRVRFDKPSTQAKRLRVTQSLALLKTRTGADADTIVAPPTMPKSRPLSEDPKLEGGSRDHHHHHHHHHKHHHDTHNGRHGVDQHRHETRPRAVSQPTAHNSHEKHSRHADRSHGDHPRFLHDSAEKPRASSSSWPSRIGRPKIKGLSNPGLWCYRRSVMQALLCLPQLCRVLEYHKPCNGACITCAMSQVFEAYHQGDGLRRQVQTLDKVIASTGRRSDPPWKHTGHSQEDAHMFLQYLVGNIETARGMPKDSFRHAILIQHVASWTCQGCKKVHHHTDPPSCSLQLPIAQSRDKQTTLEHCLNRYHKEEDLTIRCDGCKSNRPRTRQHKIKHPPDVLTIQLKRFQTSLTGRGVQKNSRRVKIDTTLDLGPWCAGEKKSRFYRLQAVVAHSGSLNMGHYVAYVRHQDQIKLVNDETISAVASSEWVSPRAYDPYILVYTRT